MHVVVVESPAKAKTINKYLGKDYTVLASFGHVRDLPPKDGSVRPEEDFAMTYEVEADSKKHITAIADAVKKANTLYLATDPDREGEAISWHVLEALKGKRAIPKNVDVKRITFNEITKSAVQHAIAHPRDIDMDLVNAQQARRALDYLVGFTLSPVLWRKLPGSKSAGRVQSVALRLVCEREEEIERFVSREYWDVWGVFTGAAGQPVRARLTEYEGAKLDKFDIPNEARAKEIQARVSAVDYTVKSVEPKQVKRHPQAPFTTSTLQQEASRKCGFGAKKTMQIAQKLYEGVAIGGETTGLITYMRTDGVSVAPEAIQATRGLIGKQFGAPYLPKAPRAYTAKAKNAQEAHEAIRPTDVNRTPESVRQYLDADQLRLYELIWKRMVASQMESALLDQVSVDIAATDQRAVFRATGSVVAFDGFMVLYREGRDDDGEDEDQRLPRLTVGEGVTAKDIVPEQHFTEPPPRYSEASLVKKLEELGIGRPSTYASILSVLQERDYVKLDKKRFVPEARGRLVSAFLVSFFERYVQYDFTANLEQLLDNVSAGEIDWKQVLREFWTHFSTNVDEAKKYTLTQVLDALNRLLEPYLFPARADGKPAHACPTCADGSLSLKLGKFGAFLGCSNYPTCNYTRELTGNAAEGDTSGADSVAAGPRELGLDPASGMMVTVRKGPYGHYIQLGDGAKPKRISLPKGMTPDSVTIEQALALITLPREIGTHPETGKPISAGLGRFGPYLLHDGKYTSLPAGDDVLSVGINRAVDLIAGSGRKGVRTAVEPLRVLGQHPDGGDVALYEGKYGPYVKHGKVNATLPKGSDMNAFSLEEAVALLAGKAAAPAKVKGGFKKKAKG